MQFFLKLQILYTLDWSPSLCSTFFTQHLSPTNILHCLLIYFLFCSSKIVSFMKVWICIYLFTDIYQVPRTWPGTQLLNTKMTFLQLFILFSVSWFYLPPHMCFFSAQFHLLWRRAHIFSISSSCQRGLGILVPMPTTHSDRLTRSDEPRPPIKILFSHCCCLPS